MVHISKHPLKQDVFTKMYQLFFEIINRTYDKDSFLLIMKDILSPPEQIMVAKRIAIIYLITKGANTQTISGYLKVSKSTVSKYALLFYKKETKTIEIIKSLLGKEKVINLLEDTFTDIFIQPGIKIGHWDSYWRHKKKQKERKMLNV